jgi:hypothetical protein
MSIRDVSLSLTVAARDADSVQDWTNHQQPRTSRTGHFLKCEAQIVISPHIMTVIKPKSGRFALLFHNLSTCTRVTD